MPSKSDIQFGKIAVANHLATREEVEECLKEQARFEKERHTLILEPLLLSRDILTFDQVEAIQNKMNRRVVFCPKCHGKFNVHQFRGNEKFLCHKCGNRVTVPDGEAYRDILKGLLEKVQAFLSGEEDLEAEPLPEEKEEKEPRRETIMVSREDIEMAKASRRPAEEEGGEAVQEVELEGEIETEEEGEEAGAPAGEEPLPALEGEGEEPPAEAAPAMEETPPEGTPAPEEEVLEAEPVSEAEPEEAEAPEEKPPPKKEKKIRLKKKGRKEKEDKKDKKEKKDKSKKERPAKEGGRPKIRGLKKKKGAKGKEGSRRSKRKG